MKSMAGYRRDYEVIVSGKRMLEVFFYHSSGKEAHVSIMRKEMVGQYDYIFDPSFDVPTDFDISTSETLAGKYLAPGYNWGGFYDYPRYGYNENEAKNFLLAASERLKDVSEPSPYFAHYGKEILLLYNAFPRLFSELRLNIYDYAKFFYPLRLEGIEERFFFNESKNSMKFAVPFFLEAIEAGSISIDFAINLSFLRPRFNEELMKRFDLIASNPSNDEYLCRLASKYPFINSPKTNSVLLEINHGIGIKCQPLLNYLDQKEKYDEIAYVLSHSGAYRTIIAISEDSHYLYYLSLLRKHGYGEEAIKIAKDICKKTYDPEIYSYLSSFFSKEEKILLAKSNEAASFPCSLYAGDNSRFSFFLADLNPNRIEEKVDIIYKYELYGAGLLPVKGVDPNDVTDYKRTIRETIKRKVSPNYGYASSKVSEAEVLSSIKFNDAPSYKALFEDNKNSALPYLRALKAEWKRSQPKKGEGVKPYIVKKEEDDVC